MKNNWQDFKEVISRLRLEAQQKKAENINNRIHENNFEIYLPASVLLTETDEYLEIKGPKNDLIKITEDLKAMELLEPGDYLTIGNYLLLVSDGAVNAFKEEKCFMLPADDWLMMGCKFADALFGHDSNPYLFYSSPFNDESLNYGIQLTITDIEPSDDYFYE